VVYVALTRESSHQPWLRDVQKAAWYLDLKASIPDTMATTNRISDINLIFFIIKVFID
jgi:hypothetical protein